jgi:hypothetical protein
VHRAVIGLQSHLAQVERTRKGLQCGQLRDDGSNLCGVGGDPARRRIEAVAIEAFGLHEEGPLCFVLLARGPARFGRGGAGCELALGAAKALLRVRKGGVAGPDERGGRTGQKCARGEGYEPRLPSFARTRTRAL